MESMLLIVTTRGFFPCCPTSHPQPAAAADATWAREGEVPASLNGRYLKRCD